MLVFGTAGAVLPPQALPSGSATSPADSSHYPAHGFGMTAHIPSGPEEPPLCDASYPELICRTLSVINDAIPHFSLKGGEIRSPMSMNRSWEERMRFG